MVANNTQLLGWREWVSLPELGIPAIKAKVDTGAKTSALHAFFIERFREDNKNKVRFHIHPLRHDYERVVVCVAEIIDMRWVSDSGGHREERCVIQTPLQLGHEQWPIEVTLTNRESMLFRMLLGRSALKSRYAVNPSVSYLMGKDKIFREQE